MTSAETLSRRCPRCLLARCLCASLPRVEARTRIVLVRHLNERYRSSNTARLAALALPCAAPAARADFILDPASASTDMGNVSHVIPSIHPAIGIRSLPAGNHQPEFAAHCITEYGDQAVLDGALLMAWTAIDMAAEGPLRDRLLEKAYSRE